MPTMKLFIDFSIADVSKIGSQEYNLPYYSSQGNGSNHLDCEFLADCNSSEFFRFVAIVKPSLLLRV